MPPIVKDLLLSKKFLVALFAAIGAVASHFGWNMDPAAILVIMTPLLVYIGAQGWGADAGKEKAKVEQETALKLQDSHIRNELLRTNASLNDNNKMNEKMDIVKGETP